MQIACARALLESVEHASTTQVPSLSATLSVGETMLVDDDESRSSDQMKIMYALHRYIDRLFVDARAG